MGELCVWERFVHGCSWQRPPWLQRQRRAPTLRQGMWECAQRRRQRVRGSTGAAKWSCPERRFPTERGRPARPYIYCCKSGHGYCACEMPNAMSASRAVTAVHRFSPGPTSGRPPPDHVKRCRYCRSRPAMYTPLFSY
eukprot:ctg_467.g115